MKIKALVCLVLLAFVLAACSKEAETIKIGAVVSATGPASFLGEPEKNTMNMLAEKLNAKGGVLGKKIELVVYDDETDVNKCLFAVKKLIEQDKVVAVLGPSVSGNTLAVMGLAASAQVPLVSMSASEKIVRPVNPWIFNVAPLDRHAVTRILLDAAKRGFKKLAILTVSDGFGQSGRAVLQELVPAKGFELVADEVYGPKDTDMTAQLTKIRSLAPDAIICWGTNPGPAVIARNRAQLGIQIPLYMSHGVASKKFIELAGEAAEGLLLPAGRLVVAAQIPESNVQKKLLVEYAANYTKKFNSPVSTFGGHGYDSLWLVVQAIQAGKSAKPADIRANLENVPQFIGAAGVFDYTPENHNGLDENAFVMLTIEKGDWKLLE